MAFALADLLLFLYIMRLMRRMGRRSHDHFVDDGKFAR